MMRILPTPSPWNSLTGALCCGLLLAACGGNDVDDTKRESENTLEKCQDGKDNDLDGKFDCADPDCLGTGACALSSREDTRAACEDLIDNDSDGRIDCADAQCLAFTDICGPESTAAFCDDGRDNDGDLAVDCLDPDCAATTPCLGNVPENTSAFCSDGLDNDGDSFIDCRDPDCQTTAVPFCGSENTEQRCFDEIDNDGDGFVDCDDDGCEELCSGALENDNTLCSDNLDNDGDGYTDCNDFDCKYGTGVTVCSTTSNETSAEACRDRIDNDGDGFTDCKDWDCSRNNPAVTYCYRTEDGAPTSCADGIDNDGDGFFDCDDRECFDDAVCTAVAEGGTNPAECQDGLDNDSDTLVDCADPNCSSNPAVTICGSEDNDARCQDQFDNDGDGKVDCADETCATLPVCKQTAVENTAVLCADHLDNDGDGLTDCADGDCRIPAVPFCAAVEQGALCADQLDNDGDGLADCLDPGCAAVPQCLGEQPGVTCSDTLDNDSDQLADCADQDCASDALCGEETSAGFCADGFDNDGDGLIDCADNGCAASGACGGGTNEDTLATCSDNLDNDGDGFTDCADHDCLIDFSLGVCSSSWPIATVHDIQDPRDTDTITWTVGDGLQHWVRVGPVVVTSPVYASGSQRTFYVADPAGGGALGPYSGLRVFSSSAGAVLADLAPGDLLNLIGRAQDYTGVTELVLTRMLRVGSGAVPTPASVASASLDDVLPLDERGNDVRPLDGNSQYTQEDDLLTAERYEGTLVHLGATPLVVSHREYDSSWNVIGYWVITTPYDGSLLLVGRANLLGESPLDYGDVISSLTGIVEYRRKSTGTGTWLPRYIVQPRSAADLVFTTPDPLDADNDWLEDSLEEAIGTCWVASAEYTTARGVPCNQVADLADSDGDGYDDFDEVYTWTAYFPDSDGDGRINATESFLGDQDGDGWQDENDGVEWIMPGDDRDLDGLPNSIDTDDDGDGILDGDDLCPHAAFARSSRSFAFWEQEPDEDSDGIGDSCDLDIDGDGVINRQDNCPLDYNPGQEDNNGNGLGDACEIGSGYYLDPCDIDWNDDGVTDCELMITEVHYRIPGPPGVAQDSNLDGEGDVEDDEFVEILNVAPWSINLYGYQLNDGVGVRHVFPQQGSVLRPGQTLVVWGGAVGGLAAVTGNFPSATLIQLASTGTLGLNNTGGDRIELRETPANGDDLILRFDFGLSGQPTSTVNNVSITRFPQQGTRWMMHPRFTNGAGRTEAFSPADTVDSRYTTWTYLP